MESDTETLIALVSSLLTKNAPDAAILDALIQCNGQVEATAQLLNSKQNESPRKQSKKRGRVSLEDWLVPSEVEPSKHRRTSNGALGELKVASGSRRSVTPSSRLSVKSPTKPTVNLMSVLRQAPESQKATPRLPPLMLSTPALVAENTPCTLHLSVLPPDLACKLFYTMFDASRTWQRNKWWLFDRVVESPHRTAFYARKDDENKTWQEAARFWYNGRVSAEPKTFPPSMEEACRIVERIVVEEMKKRKRFPLEWRGNSSTDPLWRANVAASNCYEGGKESVGFHSDQLTNLGPYPTIASLSLGTTRLFRLREVIPTNDKGDRQAQTFNIPLSHNSLTIMHAPCQEQFKHCIPPQPVIDVYRPAFPRTPGAAIETSNSRINITFRFYRPDFLPSSIPHCKCDIPAILRPDMKKKFDDKKNRYWWTCYAGAQNEGKGCNFWKVMDMEAEGRGPCIGNERVSVEQV